MAKQDKKEIPQESVSEYTSASRNLFQILVEVVKSNVNKVVTGKSKIEVIDL